MNKSSHSHYAILIIICSIIILPGFAVEAEFSSISQAPQGPLWFTVEGLVENKLNLTYAELQHFPAVSELTMLQCVGGGQGGLKVTYNWTGVPLFYVLSLAKVIPGNFRKVVFNATDGFSSAIMLDAAMEPTTLIGLKANGTDLEQVSGLGNGYKIVLPGRWGYKWVKWVKQIIVVDYDYKGSYESNGLSDEAFRPGAAMPQTNPPTLNFTAWAPPNQTVRILSNSSVTSFSATQGKMMFDVAGEEGTSGYAYVTFRRDLLDGPFTVHIDQENVVVVCTYAAGNAYLFFTFENSNHSVEIGGTQQMPTGGGYRSSNYLLR